MLRWKNRMHLRAAKKNKIERAICQIQKNTKANLKYTPGKEKSQALINYMMHERSFSETELILKELILKIEDPFVNTAHIIQSKETLLLVSSSIRDRFRLRMRMPYFS